MESVYPHRHPAGSGSQKASRHACNIQPAYFSHYINGIFRIRLVYLYGLPDDLYLFPQSLAGEPRPPACHLFRLSVKQHGGAGGTGGCISDSHLPGNNQVVSLLLQLLCDPYALFNGPDTFLPAHGRLDSNIARSVADSPVADLSWTPSTFIPILTGTTSAFRIRDMTHTLLIPCPIFSRTWAVTSLPVWLTPSLTTPLSAPIMTIARFRQQGFSVPESPPAGPPSLPVFQIPAEACTGNPSAPRLSCRCLDQRIGSFYCFLQFHITLSPIFPGWPPGFLP